MILDIYGGDEEQRRHHVIVWRTAGRKNKLLRILCDFY